MKPFIYASALLLTAGSAFGLVDYFSAKKDGTLSRLYHDDAPAQTTAANTGKTAVKAVTNTEAALTTENKNPVAVATVNTTPVPEKKTKKKAPVKKISLKMFSRGDEIIPEKFEPPIIVEEKKEAEKAAPVEPVKEEIAPAPPPPPPPPPAVKKNRRSLTKLFSRARPPREEVVEVKSNQ